MEKEQLSTMIDNGGSIRSIAKQTGYGISTIRYWIKKHDLSTVRKTSNGVTGYKCCRCGETYPEKFYGNKKTMCGKCHNLYCKESGWEKKKKALDFLGGKCQRCGYERYAGALDFHHIVPEQKDPRWKYMRGWRWEKIQEHLKGCVLLCSNCHREFHGGLFKIEDI